MPRRAIHIAVALLTLALNLPAQASSAAEQYRLLDSAKVGGEGGFDFVTADAVGRKLYIPRSAGPNSRVSIFDLDTLKPVGQISNTQSVHGVAIDPKSGHGFSSSKPVVMFDTKTFETIKTIDAQGNPDCILFEPATQRIYILSHAAPNATVINSVDGSVVGTIDLGGEPEQAASDGQGNIYIALEDKNEVAVVDAKALKVTARYKLDKGEAPAGLALDPKNHILFVCCQNPQIAVILNAIDGKIITTLPIGAGVDSALFNPATMEAFSSQRDGTLTVIKENSPTDFTVEQNVQTKPGAKTCSLDEKTNRILLITAEPAPAAAAVPAPPAGETKTPDPKTAPTRRSRWLPDSFTILVVGK